MKPKIIRSTEGRALMGGRQTIKLNAADTAKKMSVTYSVVPANSGVPVHIHSREHETFQIVDGELEVILNGEAQLLKKGDMVFMPKHIPHGFKALKDTSMWVTLVPGGAENMFVEVAGLLPGPPDMEKVAALAESYGIKFV